MTRVQIGISETLYKRLLQISRERSVPMERFVCTILQACVDQLQHEETAGIQVLKNIVTLKLKGGTKDLSTRLDHYLYGAPKKCAQ